MKKLILYSFVSLFLISSCRESDNANVPEFTKVPMPTVKRVSGDASISAQDPATFNTKFTVGLYFPDADKPAKMDVVVRKNLDNATTKVFKGDVTTYPSEFTITGADLKALFGADIVLGDKFDIGVDLTLNNGQKYLAFPTVGVPYGSGVASPAGSSTSARFEAVCKFTAADYAGNFEVLVDDWNDFKVGTIIPVSVVSDSKLSIISPVSGKPIIIDINTGTNVAKVEKQDYGDYKAAGLDPDWTYGMSYATSVNSAENFVAPCEMILSVELQYSVGAGTFQGTYVLKLKKK